MIGGQAGLTEKKEYSLQTMLEFLKLSSSICLVPIYRIFFRVMKLRMGSLFSYVYEMFVVI